MNTCNSYHSPTQTLINPSNHPPISSLPSHVSFKFTHTHVKISPIPIRQPKITTKRSKTTASATVSAAGCRKTSPETETLYDLLGISANVTLSEIKHAYKKMALKYHPDVSPPHTAEENAVRFIRVQEAYETLSDPEARSVYDRCMAKGLPFGFSGRWETRVDPRSGDKQRWKEVWKGQLSDLTRRSRVDPTEGVSWAARIRKQRSGSCGYGSGSDE